MDAIQHTSWNVLAAIGWGAAGFMGCLLLLRTQRNTPAPNREEPCSTATKQDTSRASANGPAGQPRPRSSAPCSPNVSSGGSCPVPHSQDMERLLRQNRAWASAQHAADPTFFDALCRQQHPDYLWIGCSDSRVPANQILGMAPGEVFVQRNVGNQAAPTDLNLSSCLEYAVAALKVKTIIVCGHYGCGAVQAALTAPHSTPSLVNCWIADIRECREAAAAELHGLEPKEALDRLCELNVVRQLFRVATSPVVAAAWGRGQPLALYGLVYDLADGLLHKLAGPLTGDTGCPASLEGFVAGNCQVVRSPTSRRLLLTGPDGTPVSMSARTSVDEPRALAAAAAVSAAAVTEGLVCSCKHSPASSKAGGDGEDAGGGEGAELPASSSRSSLESSCTACSQAEGLVGAEQQQADGSLLGARAELAAALTTANVMEQLNSFSAWAAN